MSEPRVEGFTIGTPIGEGGCGRVFRALGEDGGELALKVFDGMAINRSLLAKSTKRLTEGGWPEGVMPVWAAGFDARPATRVTPLCGVETGEGWQPATLELRIGEHPGEGTWDLVHKIAAALAAMHDRRVAHGNLKPGNVFFDEEGKVLLNDWALGNMPGAARFEFTDSLLYQPPEQLREPGGYLEEAGYRWDVFAFGTLAFRLLTGHFPRCDATFQKVLPSPGTTRREGIAANLPKIAKALESHDEVAWPDEPDGRLEEVLRGVIDWCLELDPFRRPTSMVIVLQLLEQAVEADAAEAEREALMDQRRHATQRAWRANVGAGIALGAAIVLGSLLVTARSHFRRERGASIEELRELRGRTGAAEEAKAMAENDAKKARRTLEWEDDRWLARLEASREIGDKLFEWAMAAGARRLPALEDRESRLRKLERYYCDFVLRTEGAEGAEGLAAERARVKLQLAEVSLALGEAEAAATRLDDALEAWRGQESGPELQLRLATDRVLYALLRQDLGERDLTSDFAAARRALEKLPLTDVDGARVKHLLAEVDLAEARDLARRGEDGLALELLMRATVALNELADQRPDTAVIRSQLASCYLSSAGILEGMAKFGDAREARTLASEELKRLLKGDAENPRLRSELAGTYGAMAEAAVVAGDIAAAVRLSTEATTMLEKLRQEQPADTAVAVRLAAQRGLMAGLHIDRGQAADALILIDRGIQLVEGIPASVSPLARYRLALLWWQKARLLGLGGKAAEELALERRSLEELHRLESEPAEGLRTEQIRRSMAYLLGDLAHAAEIAGDKEEAAKHFAASVKIWELLCKSRPGQEEYDEGLAWSRERLKEVGGE